MAPATRSIRPVKRHQETTVETETEKEIESAQPARKRRRGGGGNNDLENRTCSICNRVFTKASHMRNHVAVHDPDRQKYTCPQPNCNMQYNDVKNWRVHFMKNHTRGPKKAKAQQLTKSEKKLNMVNVI